jgi:hypothetical protein
MVVAGTILFGLYAALVALFRPLFSLPLLVGATVLFVGLQYKLGKWLALGSVDAEELPAAEYPAVHRAVEDLSDEMGIDKPRLLVGRWASRTPSPSVGEVPASSWSRTPCWNCSTRTNWRASSPTNSPTSRTATSC